MLLPVTNVRHQLRHLGIATAALIRVNLLPVHIHVECARTAHFHRHRLFEFAFQILFQAHGLNFNVMSEEAALDDDFHRGVPVITGVWLIEP